MSTQTRATLKSYFETGDKPTQQQFADLIDSMALTNESSSNSSNTFDYPANESLTNAHINRLVMDNGSGEAVLTQKNSGSEGQPSIVQFAIQEDATIAQPINPIFELQLLANLTDGDFITLPFPINTWELTFTAKDSPVATSDFQIGSTLSDTRDNLATLITMRYNENYTVVSVTTADSDKIIIEFLQSPVDSSDTSTMSDFCLPEDFNSLNTPSTNTTSVFGWSQTQSGANGILADAYTGSIGSYEINTNTKITITVSDGSENQDIWLVLQYLLRTNVRNGASKWGLKIANDATGLIDNLHMLFEENSPVSIPLYDLFDVSVIDTIEVEVGQPTLYFRITQKSNTHITDINTNILSFYSDIIQEYQAESYAFVTGLVLGFLQSIENGIAKISKSFINTAVLEDGSDTLPNEEMGIFSPFKRFLVPSDDGKLANFVVQPYADVDPTPMEVNIALTATGVFIAIEEKTSGNVLVRYQSAQV